MLDVVLEIKCMQKRGKNSSLPEGFIYLQKYAIQNAIDINIFRHIKI